MKKICTFVLVSWLISQNAFSATTTLNNGDTINVTNGTLGTDGYIGAASGDGTVSFSGTNTQLDLLGDTNHELQEIIFDSGATLNSANLNALDITLHNGSTINVDSGAIYGAVNGYNDGEGTINFNGDNQLTGNIGGSYVVDAINVLSGTYTIDTSDYGINANSINISSGATLSWGQGNLGTLIQGSSDGVGTVNILDIGSTRSLAQDIGTGSTRLDTVSFAGTTELGFSSVYAHDLDFTSGSVTTLGSGTLAGDLNVSGTLNFSTGNVITGNITSSGSGLINIGSDTNNITGDITTNSGTSLGVTASSSSAGSIITTGMVTLDTNTSLKVAVSGSITSNASYTILSGSSVSNNIADSNIDVENSGSNIFNNMLYSTLLSGNDLILQISAYHNPITFGNNSNSQSAYRNLANIGGASGAILTMQNYFNSSASNYDKNQAADSLSPQVDNSINRVSFDMINSSATVSSDRLASLQSGIVSYNSKEKNFWVQPFGSFIHQGKTSSSNGYKANASGVAFGRDREIADNLIVGLSASYASSSIKAVGGVKSINVDVYQLNLYSGYSVDKFFINSVIGASWNDYRSNRLIPVAGVSAKSNYDGQSYIARFETGLNHKFHDNFIFTPSFTVTAARNSTSSYSESNASNLSLNIKNNNASLFETRSGMKLSKIVSNKEGLKFAPEVSMSYGYDFAGAKQKTTANFSGQTANFSAASSRVAQGSLIIGTGLNILTKNSINLAGNYDYEMRNQYHGHALYLRAKYNF